MKIKMKRAVGILKEGGVYSLLEGYENELNVCINAEQREGFPVIPEFHDKREKHRNFNYVN